MKISARRVLSILLMILSTCGGCSRLSSFSLEDLSITQSLNIATTQRVYMISYAKGEVYERNQNCLAASAVNRGIDTIISYRKQHINEQFYQKNKNILDMRRGAGYWLWKPHLMLETLKTMAPNDILIYVDAGIYLKGSIEPVLKIFDDSTIDILLFSNKHKNRPHIKRDTYDIMEVDYEHQNDTHIDASVIAIRKTPHSCDFIEKWLHYCCIEQALTDAPSKAEEFKKFVDHRHDQAILSLLVKKFPDPAIKVVGKKKKFNIFVHHRRGSAESPL
jgi:hypothetical protein